MTSIHYYYIPTLGRQQPSCSRISCHYDATHRIYSLSLLEADERYTILLKEAKTKVWSYEKIITKLGRHAVNVQGHYSRRRITRCKLYKTLYSSNSRATCSRPFQRQRPRKRRKRGKRPRRFRKNHPKRNKSLFCKNSRKRTELDSCVLTRNTTGGAESTSTRLAHTSTLTQRRPPPLLHLQQPENPRNHRQPQPRGVGNL